jgi:hypothetical protein
MVLPLPPTFLSLSPISFYTPPQQYQIVCSLN